jgi:hypothetical protein
MNAVEVEDAVEDQSRRELANSTHLKHAPSQVLNLSIWNEVWGFKLSILGVEVSRESLRRVLLSQQLAYRTVGL